MNSNLFFIEIDENLHSLGLLVSHIDFRVQMLKFPSKILRMLSAIGGNALNQPDYKLDLGKLLSLSSVGPNVNKVLWKII